jgi:hypothetical protein
MLQEKKKVEATGFFALAGEVFMPVSIKTNT